MHDDAKILRNDVYHIRGVEWCDASIPSYIVAVKVLRPWPIWNMRNTHLTINTLAHLWDNSSRAKKFLEKQFLEKTVVPYGTKQLCLFYSIELAKHLIEHNFLLCIQQLLIFLIHAHV